MKREKSIQTLLSILCLIAIGHCKHVARNDNNDNVDDADSVTENEENNVDAKVEKHKIVGSHESLEIPYDSDQCDETHPDKKIHEQSAEDKDCWLDLGIKKLYDDMDKLDERSEKTKHDFQNAVGTDRFDKEMLKAILDDQGMAQRTLHHAGGDIQRIPAGLNLGGYCMVRMEESILFFHRMKLRHITQFRINYLHNDLVNMLLTARLSLQDLYLYGEYERATTPHNPSYLVYKPTHGEIEVILKDAEYKMEGRYRLLKGRLVIELVVSEITVKDVVLKCPSCENKIIRKKLSFNVNKRKGPMDEFLQRLKLDLDRWLKDYFNDYLTLFVLPNGAFASRQGNSILKCDQAKALVLNKFVDRSLDLFKYKLRKMRAVALKVPDFTLHTSTGTIIKLRRGVLRGLDSMHRRSIATGKKDAQVRYVDAIIGFSKLKLEYKYETRLMQDLPPLHGLFILSADELTAQLGLALVKDPQAFDLTIEFSQQVKPESLTVEGSINRRIANFRHLLENHIISIMSNTLIHHIRMLSYLSKCGTNNAPISGYVDTDEIFSAENFPMQKLTRKPTTSPQKLIEHPTVPPQDDGNDSGKDGNDGGNDYNNNDKDNNGKNKYKYRGNDKGTGYGVNRMESAELVLPSIDGKPQKTMNLKYKQTFSLDEIDAKNKFESDKDGNNNDNDSNDNGKYNNESSGDDKGTDKYKDRGNDKGQNYVVNRIESAEMVLPSVNGKPEKTMHLNYNETFSLNKANSKTRYESYNEGNENGKDGNKDNSKNNNASYKNNNDYDKTGNDKKGGNNKGTGYGVNRMESAELVLPPTDGKPAKTMNLKYKQTFSLDEINAKNKYESDKDDKNNYKYDEDSSKDNNEIDIDKGKDGSNNKGTETGYAVNRIESAELVLPPINGKPAKTMNLKYKEKFSLDEVKPKYK